MTIIIVYLISSSLSYLVIFNTLTNFTLDGGVGSLYNDGGKPSSFCCLSQPDSICGSGSVSSHPVFAPRYQLFSVLMESFNVSDAGMESGLYMKPLTDKESVALCLCDLLDYYEKQTGIYYGDLVRKAYTVGLKANRNSLLQLAKRDEIKYRLDKAMEAKGLNDYNRIIPYPELVKLKKELDETIQYIQKIGYSKLTPEQYRAKVQEIKNG